MRNELLILDAGQAKVQVIDQFPLYFFQESKVLVKGENQSIIIYMNYDWFRDVCNIRGFETVKLISLM